MTYGSLAAQDQDGVREAGARPSVDPGPSDWLTLRLDGPRAQVWTGPRALRYQRLQVRAIGLAFVVGGAALLAASSWAWLAIAVGPLLMALAPRLAPERALVEVDHRSGLLTPLAGSGAEGASVALARIAAVTGAWETFGWSSRSAIYALEADGARRLILALGGTNDAFAEAACRELGRLLELPSTYTGSSGKTLRCDDRPVA